jgi:hypothetical protein
MFQTEVVEKVKTYILCLITFFKNCAIYETWKNIEEPEATDDNMAHAHFTLCT